MDKTKGAVEILSSKPISELMSEVVIKVCSVSDLPNRKNMIINRRVGQEIASGLPGAPIAGQYNQWTSDFMGHSGVPSSVHQGKVVYRDDTRPYGFVDPASSPWYQDFEEDGEINTYLMCKGYLWTKQYQEAEKAINSGQSMELNTSKSSGYYDGQVFIYTSATLDKLCILGEDVEPCYAHSKILSNFSMQYENVKNEVEKTLGKKYILINETVKMEEQLISAVESFKNYSLEKVSVGTTLELAIEKQLDERGIYGYVREIFLENGALYVIFEDNQTLERFKCEVFSTVGGETILGTEITPVELIWRPKNTESLDKMGEFSLESSELPNSEVENFTSKEEGEKMEDIENLAGSAESAVEPIGQENTEDKENTGNVENAENTENNENAVETSASAGTDNNTLANQPIETGVKEESSMVVPVGTVKEGLEKAVEELDSATVPPTEPEPAKVDSAELEKLREELKEKERELLSLKEVQKEKETEEKAKIIAEYSELVPETTINEIQAEMGNFSLEQVEMRCAAAYGQMMKEKASGEINGKFQLNIGSVSGSPSMPAFVKQALAIEQSRII